MLSRLLGLCGGIVLLCSLSIAQEIPPELQPSIETSVDRNEITIGDDILYTVKITYDPKITIEASTPGMELGQFEIKDVKIGDPERQGDRMVRTDQYILSTYFTGDYTFPPLTVRFRTQAGEAGEVQTDAFDIHVRSLTEEESENLTIRDIKPPVSVKGKSRWPLVAGSAVGILALVTGLIWLIFLRRREEVEVSLEPPLPPHERALMALNALRENTDLLAQGKCKEFSMRLSSIVRIYIHGRWGIVALDRTTEEVLAELRKEGTTDFVQRKCFDIFSACDLMKFAREKTDVESGLRLIDLSVEIVEESRLDKARELESDTEPLFAIAGAGNSGEGDAR
ncbi:MAG: hypothetical protein ABIH23_09290 [bacterium]